MDIKQSYYAYLQEHGAKEKIQKIIAEGIEVWKKRPAYEWKPTVNDFGDTSGELYQVHGENIHEVKTIGDVCKTDIEVLTSYSGNSEATYCSGCGLRYPNVAEDISYDINDCLTKLREQFISANADALFAEFDIEHDDSWSDDDIYIALDEAMIDDDCSLNYDWMVKEFPQYLDDDSSGEESVFDVRC